VFELRVAESYVSKTDLNDALERFETHMLRIENKLDKIILK
jgi:ABC-type transporter lipoprotein component MlaA